MKRSPRFSRTVEYLKYHPQAVKFFYDRRVYIYSGEYGMFWRHEAAGYTPNIEEAGIFEFNTVWGYLYGADRSKRISVQIIDNTPVSRLCKQFAQMKFVDGI